MNSANRITLLMLILAAASVAGAMYFYPWPEFTQTDEEVGKPLFEEYTADKIRGIDIIKFDSDKQTLDRIKLKRRAEKWVVPAHQNFIATNTAIIGRAINSLNDRTVYEVISENQEDHIKYGVLDPTEFTDQANVSAIGQKLTLTDRNNKSVANIIVGSPRKDDPKKRYVRIPGKPRIYTIDFDAPVLNSQFAAWVSTNVLGLHQNDSERQIRKFEIDDYRIVASKNGAPQMKTRYRATLVPASGEMGIQTLQVPTEKGWKTIPTVPAQEVALKNSPFMLFNFMIDDVRKKAPEVADALLQTDDSIPNTVFDSLAKFGFFKTGLNDNQLAFDSTNGQVAVSTSDGVTTTFLIGTPGGNNSSGRAGMINHFVMILSSVDYDYLKKPQRPPGLKDDESDANKQFRRMEENWKAAVDNAKRGAREMNEIHADWYYLVSDQIIKAFRPELTLPAMSQTEKKSTANDSSDAATEEKSDSSSESNSDDK